MVAQLRGSRAQLRGYMQTVYETLATGNGMRLPATDIGLSKTQGLVSSRVLQGNRSETMPSRDEIGVAGGTGMQPDVRSIGFVLYYLSGDYSVSGPASGLYTHTFKIGSLPIGATLEKWFTDGGFGYHYIGCKPNTLNWTIGTGGLQEASVDWTGQDEVYAAAPIDATPLLYPVVGFKVPSVTISAGGSPLKTATRFEMNLSNNLEPQRVVGNAGLIAGAQEGLFSARIGADLLFESHAQYQKALNSTEESIVVTYPADGPPSGMSLQHLFDEVQYEVAGAAVPGPGGIILPMNAVAYLNDGAGLSSWRAILINDVVTYASIA